MEETKTNFIIIGDAHGHFNAISQAAAYGWVNKLTPVFLGDLTDSFTLSKMDQMRCLHFVLRELNNGAYCVWGNHDLSYIHPDHHRCSGYTKSKRDKFIKIYRDIWRHKNFVPYLFLKKHNILITHAGLSPTIFKTGQDPIEFLNEEKDKVNTSRAFKSGTLSGGIYPVGGITWLRKGECRKPLPNNIIQIVGHTPQDTHVFDETRNIHYIDTIEYGDKSILKIDKSGEPQKIHWEQYSTIGRDYGI